MAALAPGVAHHLRIMAFAGYGIGRGVDRPEDVEIEEAVVDRRHQCIGHRMRQTHQITIRPRGIDDDEIERPLDRANGIHELLKFGSLVVGDLHGVAKFDAAMHREFEVEAGAARPGASIVDVTGKALLAAIEIDGGDPLARFHQGNCNMQGGGGFP